MMNRDMYGDLIPTIDEETMNHFDLLIKGDFGNTPAILEAAHEDLAADNAAAAAAEYGRGSEREEALKKQIGLLIFEGDMMARFVSDISSRPWYLESDRARKLIK